ncbi:hypothetical protein EJ08DRAFT_650565 [Tothia fuscella]|uniref:Uncharacterized protein n=1 Tax=Tothia fuscella TaxID=1048955 RepID=A0A9P4NPP7_9PEZI|nr:hypothetical protein EJ08DRAFT_650565 [Tothia fuscella]
MAESEYETQRAKRIAENRVLMKALELGNGKTTLKRSNIDDHDAEPAKRRKVSVPPKGRQPTRQSERIASGKGEEDSNTDAVSSDIRPAKAAPPGSKSKGKQHVRKSMKTTTGVPTTKKVVKSAAELKSKSNPNPTSSTSEQQNPPKSAKNAKKTPTELYEIQAKLLAWKPSAPIPTRDPNTKEFIFDSHPNFRPNKSPLEVITEGAFGGTYLRRLYSKVLDMSFDDEWKELPEEWLKKIDVDKQLTNQEYNPEINKFGVKCGQSIEEWEAAGWINHEYDVRGWFQWYYRFFLGRRCGEEDVRQIDRWSRCVGPTSGRWRRALIKRYLSAGIRDVNDEDGEGGCVSPAVHQTCHHWAWELRQEVLDERFEDRDRGEE